MGGPIKVGGGGRAYVVDAQGRLIAHPDISRVLQKSDLADVPQVKAAREAAGGADDGTFALARDFTGVEVLSAYTAIPQLGWFVFTEQPVEEAFAPLYAMLERSGLLLLAALVAAALAEDLGDRGDVTSLVTIPDDARARGRVSLVYK